MYAATGREIVAEKTLDLLHEIGSWLSQQSTACISSAESWDDHEAGIAVWGLGGHMPGKLRKSSLESSLDLGLHPDIVEGVTGRWHHDELAGVAGMRKVLGHPNRLPDVAPCPGEAAQRLQRFLVVKRVAP